MVSPARRRPFVGTSCAPPPSRKRRSAETTAAAAETAADPQPPRAEHEKPPAPAVALKVRLKRFHAVAAWSWNANDDVCGICQAAFEGVCPGVKYPGEDCPVVSVGYSCCSILLSARLSIDSESKLLPQAHIF